MSEHKYTLGIDFGTLSARALLVRVSDGLEIGTSVRDYPHGVMDEYLDSPSGMIKLPQNWALQDPHDYIDTLGEIVPELLDKCKISANDVIAIGIDFTTSTVIPTFSDGTPICYDERFSSEPHAYVKLWKHHSAEKYAKKLTEIAEIRHEEWLPNYGGKISSEWMFPKIWQILDEAPHIYENTAYFIDASDWIVWQLTGVQSRNNCIAGFKAIHTARNGYPSKEFFAALDPRLENVIDEKCSAPIITIGSCAGYLTKSMAELTSLNEGTPVAAGNADGHVIPPALKVTSPGKMALVLGTSSGQYLISQEKVQVPGICGVVKDGVIPGMYGYEAGQAGCGDHFAWFANNFISADYKKEADELGITPIELLGRKMSKLKAGESGLLALDWWNGNRNPIIDYDLTGLIIGMNLNTKPEEIYRALVEATAFGTRMIIENFIAHGLPVDEIVATGGIANKDATTMQIYADVIGIDISVANSKQGPALSTAIFASCAAGKKRGGYDNIIEASEAMGSSADTVYHPIKNNSLIYDKLYAEFKILHDYFGRGSNDVMKRLIEIRTGVI